MTNNKPIPNYLIIRCISYNLICLCFVFLPSEIFAQKVIASFEEENDLINVKVTSGVEISRSREFPALRTHSCDVVFPETGGEVSLINLNISNWSREEALLVFIWTNEAERISLIIKDSLNHYYARQYSLKQGANHVQLPLNDLGKTDKTRVNLIGIQTEEKAVLYLDYISLDQYQPVLDKLGQWDVEYSTEIETPHHPWGSDLENRPIKSYSISPVFDGRGIIELAKRLDLDFKVLTIGRSSGEDKWGFGDFYSRRDLSLKDIEYTYGLAHNYIAEDLLFSQDFDVLIWPGIHILENYSEKVRNAILERVKNGTCLVLLYPISDKEDGAGLWTISRLKSLVAFGKWKYMKMVRSVLPEQFPDVFLVFRGCQPHTYRSPTCCKYICGNPDFNSLQTCNPPVELQRRRIHHYCRDPHPCW